MKIAIIGTHGTGKTTFAYQVAAEAKKKGKNAIVINEVARHCPFALNEGFSIDAAHWIVTSQINRELTAISEKNEFIVCDRSAYDPICYLDAQNHDRHSYEKLRLYALEWLKTYDKLFFVYPTGEKLTEDGVRCMDNSFQHEVHIQFMALMKHLRPDVVHVASSKIFDDLMRFELHEILQ